MRELILKMPMSIDGFVGGPHGEIDWIADGDLAQEIALLKSEPGGDIVAHGGTVAHINRPA